MSYDQDVRKMNMALLKSLAAFGPVCVLFGGSVKTPWFVMQVVGAGGLVVVILAHLCVSAGSIAELVGAFSIEDALPAEQASDFDEIFGADANLERHTPQGDG